MGKAKKKNKVDVEKLLLSAFVGVESAHSFSAFNPSIFTIQSLAVPQGQENMIRIGYIPSVIFSAALGGIVSLLIKSKMPLAFGIGTSGFMIFVYELAIRGAPTTPTVAASTPTRLQNAESCPVYARRSVLEGCVVKIV